MLVVASAGLALVAAAPAGPVLDAADGVQLARHAGLERGGDQAVEQAAVSAMGPRWRAWRQGSGGGAAAAVPAIRNARASMARVMNRCQPVQVRTW